MTAATKSRLQPPPVQTVADKLGIFNTVNPVETAINAQVVEGVAGEGETGKRLVVADPVRGEAP